MGRLIEADDFEKFIKEKYKDGESTDDIKDQMLFDLSYQPTAYDVEKVVAELEELKSTYNKLREVCEDKFEAYELECKCIQISKDIEIVKRGGME